MILSKEHLTDAGRLKIRLNSTFQHITTVCKTKVPSLNLTICWKLLKPKVRREMSGLLVATYAAQKVFVTIFMDITMDNQQKTNGFIIILVGSSETIRQELIRYR